MNTAMDPMWILAFSTMAMMTIFMALAWRRNTIQLTQARTYLIGAKRETEEIVQLPLNTPYPLVQLSLEGDIIFANPAALRSFPDIREYGLNHPVLTGIEAMFRHLSHPTVSLGTQRLNVRDVKHDHVIYHQTVTLARVAGHQVVMIYFYDITPLIEAQTQLEQSRRIADAANQAKGDFLANMSHELRTPMNGIIGLSDVLQESILDPEHQNLARAVHQSARSLLLLLNDILDFSKIEAGEVRLEHINFDIRALIAQIITLQEPVAVQKSLSLDHTVDDIVPAWLKGDPTRLQQILTNLINNALKFTHQGHITLHLSGATQPDGQFGLRMMVRDTGVGIPKHKQADVFAKFSQVDISTTRKYGGTGLGLSITHDLVALMKGKISLESTENEGTTFTVFIPFEIATAPSVPIHAISRNQSMQNNARLLVVDDHPVNLLLMRTVLGKMGFTDIHEASSGEQAVSACQATSYDLIFMDCQMPGMDGFQATRTIRAAQTPKNKPIIIALTADAMKGAAERCQAVGMNDYLSKPIDQARLLDILHRYLPTGTGQGDRDHLKPSMSVTSPRPSIPKTTIAIFDPARIAEFSAGDVVFQSQLIDVFITSAKEDLNKMAAHDRVNDHAGWVAMAHKIYGAAINIGALALAAVCDQAQILPFEKAEDRADLQRQMIEAYKQVRTHLTTRRAA